MQEIPVTSVAGWIVFQQRINGATNFNRTWKEYIMGFGNTTNNFWLGNAALNQLTTAQNYSLRVEMMLVDGPWFSAEYSSVWIDSESNQYAIHLSGYSGDAGDSLINPPGGAGTVNGAQFSTHDVVSISRSCSQTLPTVILSSGWWYDLCSNGQTTANLNGIYSPINAPVAGNNGLYWLSLQSNGNIEISRMMIKPI